MKKTLSVITLAALLFPAVFVFAQNKVVVIPMGSSAKGADGQVQYNDNGTTAGAEVYYDKATGKLELPGELRTVDGSGNSRLWGKGRPGTSFLTHTDPNGYCTSSAGIKHALSSHLETWGNADDVCPVGTWVCSEADLPTYGGGGACPIVPITAFQSVDCDGTFNPVAPPGEQPSFWGWVSNADESTILEYFVSVRGVGRSSSTWGAILWTPTCKMYRAWCCWE